MEYNFFVRRFVSEKNEFENLSSTLKLGYLFDYFAIYSITWSNILFNNIIRQIIILP